MDCPFCAVEIADDTNFCPHCGRAVAAARTGRPPAPGPAVDGDVGDRGDGPDATREVDLSETGEIPTVAGDDAPTQRVAPDDGGPATGQLRRCPNCWAQNSARRVLCGRCGVDLDSGTAPHQRHAAETTDRPGAVSREGRSTRVVVAVLVAGALIGTVAGLIAMTRADPEPVDDRVFDEGVYGDEQIALELTSVTASSTREPTEERRFDADAVADGDATTAWVAGDQDGIGETVVLRLAEPSWIGSVSVWNGDQHDQATFRGRDRPTRILVSVGGVPHFEITLLDRLGEQAVTFPEPVLGRSVEVEVLGVAAGEDGDPAALSGVELRGWIARGADRD